MGFKKEEERSETQKMGEYLQSQGLCYGILSTVLAFKCCLCFRCFDQPAKSKWVGHVGPDMGIYGIDESSQRPV